MTKSRPDPSRSPEALERWVGWNTVVMSSIMFLVYSAGMYWGSEIGTGHYVMVPLWAAGMVLGARGLLRSRRHIILAALLAGLLCVLAFAFVLVT